MYFKSAACEMQIKVYFCINCHITTGHFLHHKTEIIPLALKLDFIRPSFHCENGM